MRVAVGTRARGDQDSVADVVDTLDGLGLIAEHWSASAGVTESGGAVSDWVGRINSYTVSQGTAGSKPTYSATSFNGYLPGITFDGSDDWLGALAIALPSGADPCEIWALVDDADSANDTSIIAWGGNGLTVRKLSTVAGAGPPERLVRGTVGDSSAANTVTGTGETLGIHSLRVAVGATSTVVYRDNASENSASITPATATTRLRIGARELASPFELYNGVMRHIVVTIGLLSVDQALALDSAMQRGL